MAPPSGQLHISPTRLRADSLGKWWRGVDQLHGAGAFLACLFLARCSGGTALDRNSRQSYGGIPMKGRIKILATTLCAIRADLARPHEFAHERVGFLTAGVATSADSRLMLLGREYSPVDEDDYIPDPTVGVKIGSGAMRKALQSAYRPPAALLHIHTHGGSGRPDFSGVDRRSATEFIPSFFNPIPRMPHGILVLSDDSAKGLIWLTADRAPIPITDIISVGAPYAKYGAVI